MSNTTSVLPSFPGLAYPATRTPVWSTMMKTSVAGREYPSSKWSYPRWKYKQQYDILRGNPSLTEMQQMAGFFNSMQGMGNTFLFKDVDDYVVDVSAPQQIGVGNGAQTKFQLLRTFGGYIEPILAPKTGTVAVYKNGVNDGLYTIDLTTGIVTFTTAPGAGVVLTWAGEFYWRCRFLKDEIDFTQFMSQFWELKTLEFITVKA